MLRDCREFQGRYSNTVCRHYRLHPKLLQLQIQVLVLASTTGIDHLQYQYA
jgi:hypothetical protein